MRVVIYGAGRMAETIAGLMQSGGRYEAMLYSPDPERLSPGGASPEALGRLLRGTEAVIMAGDTWAGTADVARLARRWECHYLDVTENPQSAEAIAAIAEGAPRAFVPGCGLAPGYVTALVAEQIALCRPGARLTAHVGVLPARRTNRLGYGNIWGVDGLLAEYTLPCRAIDGGKAVALAPLTEDETITLDGETFESFTTAGSLDALVARSEGRIDRLVFKTLRYPGHLDYIRLLMEDLGLARNRNLLRNLLMNGLPLIEDDRILIALDVQPGAGAPMRRLTQTLQATQDAQGQWRSAGLAATAAHVCAVTDLLCQGRIERKGFIPQGEIPLHLLRQSPFFASLQAETLAAQEA